jgi:hypothetical protein
MLSNYFTKIVEIVGKYGGVVRPQMIIYYDAEKCKTINTHTHARACELILLLNYLLLFCCNNGNANAHQYYVTYWLRLLLDNESRNYVH